MRAVELRGIVRRDRRYFIGGSDARIIIGDDEGALLRLWREKRGEIEPEDLSGNLVVQLGVATEDLNRRWYQTNSGQVVTDIQKRVRQGSMNLASKTAPVASTRPSSVAAIQRSTGRDRQIPPVPTNYLPVREAWLRCSKISQIAFEFRSRPGVSLRPAFRALGADAMTDCRPRHPQ